MMRASLISGAPAPPRARADCGAATRPNVRALRRDKRQRRVWRETIAKCNFLRKLERGNGNAVVTYCTRLRGERIVGAGERAWGKVKDCHCKCLPLGLGDSGLSVGVESA